METAKRLVKQLIPTAKAIGSAIGTVTGKETGIRGYNSRNWYRTTDRGNIARQLLLPT